MEIKLKQVDPSQKWECCKCGWIGKHSDSADRTSVTDALYLLVCPNCGNNNEFFKADEE